MKMKEIREKNDPELKRLLQSQKEKLRSLRFKVSQKQLKDVRQLREVKRDMARLNTETKRRQQQPKKKPK
ncbi:MAG: 50S ribosomal protein L29 [Patescibacteria group bacterium]